MLLANLIATWLKETNKRDWIVGQHGKSMLAFWSPIEEIYWNLYRIEEIELHPIWPFTGMYQHDKPIVDILYSSDPDFFVKLDRAMNTAKPTIDKIRKDAIY